MSATFHWSVRRELWEHRAIWAAPLAVACLALLATVFGIHRMSDKIPLIATLEPAKQLQAVVTPFGFATSVVMLVSFLVAAFYCLDALHVERRDRSVLFWKSMPVSDRTTVLSKAFIPLVVQPLVGFAIAVATQLALLLLIVVILGAKGVDLAPLWSHFPALVRMPVIMLYGVIVHALWYAPLYGYFLLVSAATKRAPFLWAVVPIVVTVMLERIAFGTSYVGSLIRYRTVGAMGEAFARPGGDKDAIVTSFSDLTPGVFASSLGLWLGLFFFAGCITVAIRLRRHREPS
jgi:ABC-2 type transport system permease protein